MHVFRRAHLDRQHDLDDVLLDPVEHVGEELERLALVLLLRILLRIPAQVDALPQVVEIREVIAPVLVERLQHQAALELAHELGADLRFLARVLRERGLGQAVAHLLVGDLGIVLQPLAHRRLQLELRRRTRSRGPAMSHCSSIDSGGM